MASNMSPVPVGVEGSFTFNETSDDDDVNEDVRVVEASSAVFLIWVSWMFTFGCVETKWLMKGICKGQIDVIWA